MVVILSQFARSTAIFLKTDYGTLLFSVEYEGIFTTKHDDMQPTHQEGALSMPFYTKFSEQQASHFDDVNKCHYMLLDGNVLKGSYIGRGLSTEVQQIEDSNRYCCQALVGYGSYCLHKANHNIKV